MRFKHIKDTTLELDLTGLPWIQEEFRESLSNVVAFILKAYATEVSRIGLYGSWQRGNAQPGSDVDLVVFLNHEVPWFDATRGVISRSSARKDRYRWHVIEREANTYQDNLTVYSISTVTLAMLVYYAAHGPIHLQNWVHALKHCYILWGR
jgi:hypothetical protein